MLGMLRSGEVKGILVAFLYAGREGVRGSPG